MCQPEFSLLKLWWFTYQSKKSAKNSYCVLCTLSGGICTALRTWTSFAKQESAGACSICMSKTRLDELERNFLVTKCSRLVANPVIRASGLERVERDFVDRLSCQGCDCTDDMQECCDTFSGSSELGPVLKMPLPFIIITADNIAKIYRREWNRVFITK